MENNNLEGTLTRFIVIKSKLYSGAGNAYCKAEGGTVVLGEESVLSPLVKIEAERAAINSNYVNLRFCHNNRYWQKNEDGNSIVAVSTKPEEDTTKASCTLFEAIKVDGGDNWFYLIHVQSGGRLLIDNSTSLGFYVDENTGDERGNLTFVNWDTTVNLPKHVAFKGFNGSYLGGIWAGDHAFQQFSVGDPNQEITGYQMFMLPDGHVRIYSNHFTRFLRRGNNWVWADTFDTTANDINTLFWPVRIDDKTIALRNAGNNNFCESHDDQGYTRCLNAAVTTITNNARIEVQELVLMRKIYNVRYRMEDARIFSETPYSAGTTTATNYSDEETAISVSVKYEDSKTYTFSRSLSLTAGVTTSITAGVPLITEMSIQVSYQISGEFKWDKSTTTTISVEATGSVPVPAKSVAIVRYVGTMGTCDIPYTYTQQEQSSTDGTFTETEQIDGIYTGVSCYNFTFVVEKTQPL